MTWAGKGGGAPGHSPLLPFMAKEAAIFGGMGGGKRCFFIWRVAIETIFFRLLLIRYCMKSVVVFIMGEVGGGFLRSLQQKNENGGADDDEHPIDNQFIF